MKSALTRTRLTLLVLGFALTTLALNTDRALTMKAPAARPTTAASQPEGRGRRDGWAMGAPGSQTGTALLASALFEIPGIPMTAMSATGGCATPSFGTASNFGAGTNPHSVAVGDFDRDGRLDLAVANDGSNTVSVLLGDGRGGFSLPTNFGVGSHPRSVAVGDFNRDGRQDLATANLGSNNVTILLGQGDGSFSPGLPVPVGNDPVFVVVGDFDKDGIQDLAVANFDVLDGTVTILLGNGDGSFRAGSTVPVGKSPASLAVGDFNRDGIQDLAVTNWRPLDGGVTILRGTGNGGFTLVSGSPIPAGIDPFSVAVGDFDGDGRPDLAVANSGSNNVSVLLGDGMGGFSSATNFGVGSTPYSVAVGDFDGDGKPDLATANFDSANVSVLLDTCNCKSPTAAG